MVNQEFDIVGIGNAIVDVITDVSEEFLNKKELRKGLMSLVDLDSIKSLSEEIEIKANVSGGSVANSIVALAQNNIKTAFIGKVGEDKVGNSFIKGLEKENVIFANTAQSDESETGRCLVMVTPDAQRTMSTYLGISQKLNASDINKEGANNEPHHSMKVIFPEVHASEWSRAGWNFDYKINNTTTLDDLKSQVLEKLY